MLAEVGIAACVGAVVAVWVAGALYNALHTLHNASHAPRERTRSQPGSTALIIVAAVCAGLAIVSRSHFDGLAVGATWVRVLGLAVLVASTVFTLWARLSLGTMWSNVPQVKDDHQLRTRGPYALTRHPIYTGLLGMLLGATLLSGIGQWIMLFPVGLILFEVKIRMEEHLMLATFPDEYPRYRRRVPQLIPGLYVLRRHDRRKAIAENDRESETRALHPYGYAATSLPQAPSVRLPSLGRTDRFAGHGRSELAPDDHRATKR
jgi:protein-S-isoprenylcysteine O-methyltransferase Ste14